MEWFLYDNGPRHERVKVKKIMWKCLFPYIIDI